jgi:hypothetical protein
VARKGWSEDLVMYQIEETGWLIQWSSGSAYCKRPGNELSGVLLLWEKRFRNLTEDYQWKSNGNNRDGDIRHHKASVLADDKNQDYSLPEC